MAFGDYATLRDDFVRADEAGPTITGWSAWLSPGLKILSNQLRPYDPGDNGGYFNTAMGGPNVEAYIRIAWPTIPGGETAIAARVDPATGTFADATFYGAYHFPSAGTDTISLQKSVSGTVTTIGGPWNKDLAVNDMLGIRCIGSTIEAWAYTGGAWALVGSATDTSIPGTGNQNKIGLIEYGNGDAGAAYKDLYAGVVLVLDAAVIPLTLTPSSTELRTITDSNTVRLSYTPSGSDVYAPAGGAIITDAATARLSLTPSGVEGRLPPIGVDGQLTIVGQPVINAADTSYGLWEGTTNLCTNGGFETNVTGWTTHPPGGVGAAITRDTSQFMFGTASGKFAVTSGSSASPGYIDFGGDTGALRLGMLPNQTYTWSVYVRIPSTVGMLLNDVSISIYDFASGTYQNSTNAVPAAAFDGWYRLSVTRTIRAGATEAFVRVNFAHGAAGVQFFLDGAQLEQKPLDTPYVHTDGATASRTRAYVTAPASVINKTQGWVAMRIRMGWPSTIPGGYPSTQPIRLFEWDNYSAEGWMAITMGDISGRFQIDRWQSGRHALPMPSSLTWNEGDCITVIGAWDANTIKISVNGASFTTLSCVPGTPSPLTSFAIGCGNSDQDSQIIDSDVLWFACGTGPLDDAHVAALHNYGNTDPTRLDFLSPDVQPTLLWTATDASYIGAFTYTPPPTLPPGIGGLFPVQPDIPKKYFKIIHYLHDETPLGDEYPSDLEFALYLGKVGYTTYDLDRESPLAVKANCEPYKTDYALFYGDRKLQAGIHTDIEASDIESHTFKISGKDWYHWFEGQIWPFDPANPLANVYSAFGRDAFAIVEDWLTKIQSEPNTIQFTYNNGLCGVTTNAKIEPNDAEFMFSKIDTLSHGNPSFDVEITPEKEINLYYPMKSRDIDLVLEQGANIFELGYHNKGPSATKVFVQGTLPSSHAGVIVTDATGIVTYRRWMANEDIGDIPDQATLNARAANVALRHSTPGLEFSCKVIPDFVDDIFTVIQLGDNIPVYGNIGWDIIDDRFRLVSIVGKVNDEGDQEYELGFDDGSVTL